MSTPTRELLAQLAEEFNELSERLVKRAAQIAAEAPSAVTVGSRWTSLGPDVHTVAYTVELRRCADGTMQKVSETGSEAGVSAATRDVSGIAQPVSSNTGESSAAAPSPAPSSPRRWWLPFDMGDRPCSLPVFHMPEPHEWAFYWQTVVPVVEASAYDAVVRERDGWREDAMRECKKVQYWRDRCRENDALAHKRELDSGLRLAEKEQERAAAIRERDAARVELAAAHEELRKMMEVQNHNAMLHARLDVNERTCHNCHRELTATDQHWLECTACFDEEDRKRMQGEVRLKDETIAQLRAELANARRLTPEVVERAAHDCYRAWAEAPVGSDAFVLTARAALLAAGFQEVAG